MGGARPAAAANGRTGAGPRGGGGGWRTSAGSRRAVPGASWRCRDDRSESG